MPGPGTGITYKSANQLDESNKAVLLFASGSWLFHFADTGHNHQQALTVILV